MTFLTRTVKVTDVGVKTLPGTLPKTFPAAWGVVFEVTIKDIAKLCGVSVSTVSRVINDRPDVSPEVRAAVLEAVRRSNYVPNNSARVLGSSSSDAVGLVVRGLSNPFYSDIIKVIGRRIDEAGYTMVMQQIDSTEDEIQCGACLLYTSPSPRDCS